MLLEDDMHATGGGRPVGSAERVDTILDLLDLIEQIVAVIALHDQDNVRLIVRAANHPIVWVALGL